MAVAPTTQHPSLVLRSPQYAGLRLSAEEYFQLSDDGFKYELVNGVVVLSPSPTPKHQNVLKEILYQVEWYLRQHPVGMILPETDVRFDDESVYRPELVFVRTELIKRNWQRIREAPDMIVEVVSPGSRRYDSETKRSDYEQHGVKEYWLVDPDRETMTFLRLEGGRYVEVQPEGDRFASQAVQGFVLNLADVRKSFHPL